MMMIYHHMLLSQNCYIIPNIMKLIIILNFTYLKYILIMNLQPSLLYSLTCGSLFSQIPLSTNHMLGRRLPSYCQTSNTFD